MRPQDRSSRMALLAGGAMCCACSAPDEPRQGSAEPASRQLGAAIVDERPNILLILADDLGYSDLGVMGSEIATPNLDALVGDGRLLTNHHSGSVSAITRAMLMSGTDHHLVGLGSMPPITDERSGLPGYEGFLNDSALSVAELLREGGYHTYLAGKWHLGYAAAGSPPGFGYSPDQWGFERSYALLGGAPSSQFGDEPAGAVNYTEDGVYVQPGQPGQPGGPGGTPQEFYTTDFFTEKLVEYIDSNLGDGKPFFAYAAYSSPHWPLQVPEPWLSMYAGAYDEGYAVVRARRIRRQRELGLLAPHTRAAPLPPEALTPIPKTPNDGTDEARYINALHGPDAGFIDYHAGIVEKDWDSLSAAERKAQARYMEIYAGMVSNLDHNVGRLIDHLKALGEYDNTFIMFHSDNGAEGWPMDSEHPERIDEAMAEDEAYQALGTRTGPKPTPRGLQYGPRWAAVSSVPLAQTKSFFGEGGFATPAIVKLPHQERGLPPYTHFTHVTDDTATLLAVARIAPPTEPAPPLIDPETGEDLNRGKVMYHDRYVYPVTGHDLLPVLARPSARAVWREPFADETYGRAVVYSANGRWKARFTEPAFGPLDGHWELFQLARDPGETHDVSRLHRRMLASLVSTWLDYMDRVGGVEPLRPQGYYPNEPVFPPPSN